MQALRPRLISLAGSSNRFLATSTREVARKAEPKDGTLQYSALVDTVADRLDLDSRDVKQVLSEALEVIQTTVASGGKVTITGAFGYRLALVHRLCGSQGPERRGSAPWCLCVHLRAVGSGSPRSRRPRPCCLTIGRGPTVINHAGTF
jgi:Bacterial DNA-binding protein